MACLLLCLAGCSRLDEVQNHNTSIRASIEQDMPGTTKTSMSEYDASAGVYPILWSDGDAITIYVDQDTYSFTLASGSGTASAEFVGDIPMGEKLPPFAAVYPEGRIVDNDLTNTFSYFTSIPQAQRYDASKPCSAGALPMASYSANLNVFSFQLLGSVMRIPIQRPAGEVIKSLTISSAGSIPVAGDIAAAIDRTTGQVSSVTAEQGGTSSSTVTYSFGSKGYKFKGGETVLADIVVIPQKYSYGLTVRYDGQTASGEDISYSHTTESPLEMKRGYVKEFTMFTDYVFKVTDLQKAFTYEGKVNGSTSTDQQFSVDSYKYVTGTDKISGLAWTVEFSEDGGNTWSSSKPSWIKSFPPSGGRTTRTVRPNASVYANTNRYLVNNEHNEALKAAASVSDYDLSTKGGTTTMNTANMYLVNASGTYKLPLVYGNAIKNGASNTGAYQTSSVTSMGSGGRKGVFMIPNFQNHLGNGISDPYILNNAIDKNTKITASAAVLVWEDHEGLVTNVRLEGSGATGTYLKFDVPNSNIAEGNAVVGIKDANGNLAWSWHIWVTDYQLGDDVTLDCRSSLSDAPLDVDVMKLDLGYVHSIYEKIDPRSALVRLTQEETGAIAYVHVNQLEFDKHLPGYSTGYYFGFKDAIPMGVLNDDGTTSILKAYNVLEGIYDRNNATYTFADAIKQPLSAHSMEGTAYNLWNMRQTDYYVDRDNVFLLGINDYVKTVYDPSPVGYVIPSHFVFKNICESKYNVADQSDYHCDIYCRKQPSSTTVDASGGTIRFYKTQRVSASDYSLFTIVYYYHTNAYGCSNQGNAYTIGERVFDLSRMSFNVLITTNASTVRSRRE